MFLWYWRAAKCYAYLDDVECRCLQSPGRTTSLTTSLTTCVGHSGFMESLWFTRGWTLQELLAPRDVTFYNKSWNHIGTRQDLTAPIHKITNIDVIVLEHRDQLKHMSVAKRMSWAAERKTTRIEDRAYSLLGIFGVNMPMLYGEEHRAFIRLQEEIIRTSTDQSILTWRARNDSALTGLGPDPNSARILATTPAQFASCRNVQFSTGNLAQRSYDLTNAGLRITLPVVEVHNALWGILNCQQNDLWLGLQLERVETSRLHGAKKSLEKDLRAYTILPIQEGSPTKCMSLTQTKKAVLEDIIIIAKSKHSRDSQQFINLRFYNWSTSDPSKRYEIVEVMPPGLWDISNAIQPADNRYHVAHPFRPNQETAIGCVVLENALNSHCVTVSFMYDSNAQGTQRRVPYLAVSQGRPSDWNDLRESVPTHRDLYDSEKSIWKPITDIYPAKGRVMEASLQYQPNANGDLEVELRLKPAPGLIPVLKYIFTHKKTELEWAEAAQQSNSVADDIQSNDEEGEQTERMSQERGVEVVQD